MAHPLLEGFPVVLALPVQWGEQDAFGHVNNTVYFRWCESVRIVYLDRAGMSSKVPHEPIGPILANIGCNFRLPVEFPDRVEIGARVTRLGRSSFDMEHLIVSERLGIVADARSTLVVYDYASGKSTPMPEPLREAIRAIEGKPL